MSELRRRISMAFSRARFERELDEELRHHLELSGSPRRLGNIALIKEDSRAMWTFAFWEQLAQDARYGLRAMASNKLFTAMAVLSLALGIGANTAIFSFMDDILLRSLPVRKPSELALLNWQASGRTPVVHSLNGSMYPGETKGSRISPNFPFAALELLRRNREIASDVFAYASAYDLNVVARNHAEVAQGLYVSGNFYDGLGVIPAQGRLISVEDDRAGAPAVVAITYDYWQSHFASDPKAVGQTIAINNIPFTIVGVSAPGFYGVDGALATAVFLPLHARPLMSPNQADQEKHRFFDANFYWIEIMARLRPGVSREQAQNRFGEVFHRFVLSTAASENEKKVVPELRVQDGASGLNQLRNRYSKPRYILMAMVGLILVIACANIANLLLARSTARRREMAIRLSLGAGRLRIVRQLLTESVLMALMGGVAGLAIGWLGIRALTWLMISGEGELTVRATLNLPVLGFTFALAVGTGVLFGLAPALQSARRDVAPALKESRIGESSGPRRFGLSRILLVS